MSSWGKAWGKSWGGSWGRIAVIIAISQLPEYIRYVTMQIEQKQVMIKKEYRNVNV